MTAEFLKLQDRGREFWSNFKEALIFSEENQVFGGWNLGPRRWIWSNRWLNLRWNVKFCTNFVNFVRFFNTVTIKSWTPQKVAWFWNCRTTGLTHFLCQIGRKDLPLHWKICYIRRGWCEWTPLEWRLKNFCELRVSLINCSLLHLSARVVLKLAFEKLTFQLAGDNKEKAVLFVLKILVLIEKMLGNGYWNPRS